MVFQSFALWPHMTVFQQVLFPLSHHQFVSPDIKKERSLHVQTMLSMVGLSDYGHRYPGRVVRWSKATSSDRTRTCSTTRSLLLMDEPLSSLDAELRMELRKEIQTIHRNSKAAIIYVTHDQGEALAMADRIIVMQKGEIEQIGTAEDIYLKPTTPFVAKFVSKANLIPGSWDNDEFSPFDQIHVKWDGAKIHPSFRKEGVYPIRPEQLQLQSKGEAYELKGTIENVLFQGRDVLYAVSCHGELFNFVELIARIVSSE